MTRTGTSDGSAPNIGKIDREPDLAADAWACNVFASEQAESKTHTVAERVLSAYHDLELASAQIPVIAKPAVKLTTQRQPGREVVQDRKAAGEHMAARGCDPQHARAGVTGEQVAYVASNPGLAGNGLLRDEVEPVVGQSRTKLLARVPGWKLNVQARAQSRQAGGLGLFVEVPLHSYVRVAPAGGGRGS